MPSVGRPLSRPAPTGGAAKKSGRPRAPSGTTGDPGLLRRALTEVLRRALVEPGVERILDRLLVDQVDQDRGRAVAHLEGTLSDLRVAPAFLQRIHLRRQRVAGHDDQLLLLQL